MKILRIAATMNGKFESNSNNYDESNLNRRRGVGARFALPVLRRLRAEVAASGGHPTTLLCAKVIRSRERFDLRRHVGNASNAVCRVAAFEDPDSAVRPGALVVPAGTERLVTGEPLRANLSRQDGLRRFGRNRLRANLRNEKIGGDSREE